MAFWNREKISYEKLNQMVDEAMDGSFSEESYTESELSKLKANGPAFWPPPASPAASFRKKRKKSRS